MRLLDMEIQAPIMMEREADHAGHLLALIRFLVLYYLRVLYNACIELDC